MNKTFQKSAVRIFAAALFFLCLQKSWAGALFYEGQRAFKRQDLSRTISAFKKAEKWDSKNPELAYLLGQTALELGRQRKEKSWLELAQSRFEKVTAALPYYGKAWLYRGLARIALKEQSKEGFSPAEWKETREFFIRAGEKEPENAWIAYAMGVNFFQQDRLLSAGEQEMAVSEIKRSIRLAFQKPSSQFLEKPSPFLRPALTFLWDRSPDFSLLKSIVPADRVSYQNFLEWMDQNGLWKYRDPIFSVYLKLQREAYEFQCRQGEEFLKKGEYKKAYWAFRKAFWMRSWAYLRAKAGILSAQAAMGQLPAGAHPLWKEEVEKTVERILEEEDEEMGGLIPELKSRMGKIHNSVSSNTIRKKGPARTFYPAKEWWAKDIPSPQMRRQGRMTMGLDLPPGHVRMRLNFRAQGVQAGKKGAYARVSLNDREIGGAYVDQKEWRPVDFEIDTAGGKRWLQVDFLNGAGPAGFPKIILELGDVERID